MRTQVTTITPETLVGTAYQLMPLRGSRIRHLPVVAGENVLVGILTDRDVRRATASDAPSMAEQELMYVLEKLRVRDIMTQDVATVSGTTPLVEAGHSCSRKVRMPSSDTRRPPARRHPHRHRSFTCLCRAARHREGRLMQV